MKRVCELCMILYVYIYIDIEWTWKISFHSITLSNCPSFAYLHRETHRESHTGRDTERDPQRVTQRVTQRDTQRDTETQAIHRTSFAYLLSSAASAVATVNALATHVVYQVVADAHTC